MQLENGKQQLHACLGTLESIHWIKVSTCSVWTISGFLGNRMVKLTGKKSLILKSFERTKNWILICLSCCSRFIDITPSNVWDFLFLFLWFHIRMIMIHPEMRLSRGFLIFHVGMRTLVSSESYNTVFTHAYLYTPEAKFTMKFHGEKWTERLHFGLGLSKCYLWGKQSQPPPKNGVLLTAEYSAKTPRVLHSGVHSAHGVTEVFVCSSWRGTKM